MAYDVEAVRRDFPIFDRGFSGYLLTYLDSANTSHKPQAVIDEVAEFYARHNANVARAMYGLGAEATAAYEGAREKIARFIGAASSSEVIFTKNASEALNLAANTLGSQLRPGDEVVISVLEHHSNIVPWQLLCERTGAVLRWFDITEDGQLDLEAAERDGLINEKTKIVSLAWVSNVLGTVLPIRALAEQAHAVGAKFVVDGSQGVPHLPTSVQELGADLVAFTGHKMLGPTGIGVVWGKLDLLAELPPFLGGGEMIEIVRMTGSTFAPPPHRFEAGTPPIAQVVGLGRAVDYLNEIGMDAIAKHEAEITNYALMRLIEVPGLKILGPTNPENRAAVFSFTLDGIHPHDVMQMLDARGVAVRGGHHCARPVHERLGIQSSSRASAYLYTTPTEIDTLVDALTWTSDFFGRMR